MHDGTAGEMMAITVVLFAAFAVYCSQPGSRP